MGLLEDKAELRTYMRQVRAGINATSRKKAEDDIAERLYNLPAIRNAGLVGVYQAYGSEVSVNDLVRALRLLDPSPKVAYPVVRGEGNMIFAIVETGEQPNFLLNPGAIVGIEDLKMDRIIEAKDIDILLVPGVAFDENCRRLGQGGGYYDRLLPHLKADCLAVGVAFDEQICEQVPAGVHDRRVDYVVTPTRIIRR